MIKLEDISSDVAYAAIPSLNAPNPRRKTIVGLALLSLALVGCAVFVPRGQTQASSNKYVTTILSRQTVPAASSLRQSRAAPVPAPAPLRPAPLPRSNVIARMQPVKNEFLSVEQPEPMPLLAKPAPQPTGNRVWSLDSILALDESPNSDNVADSAPPKVPTTPVVADYGVDFRARPLPASPVDQERAQEETKVPSSAFEALAESDLKPKPESAPESLPEPVLRLAAETSPEDSASSRESDPKETKVAADDYAGGAPSRRSSFALPLVAAVGSALTLAGVAFSRKLKGSRSLLPTSASMNRSTYARLSTRLNALPDDAAGFPSSTNEPPAPPKPKKLQKVEQIKVDSNYLRDPLKEEMENGEMFVTHDGYQILKYHGSYMQDNRDNRTKGYKEYSFMLRLKAPAGEIPAGLYQLLDDLCDTYGEHHLRATTRQAFQLHGVLKGDLKTVIAELMKFGSSTVGACGDVSRNVMTTPAPFTDKPEYEYARLYSKAMAELFKPQSTAFTELWLGEEMAATVEYWKKDVAHMDLDNFHRADQGNGIITADGVEPLYGKQYLPKKFKIGITVPGDNAIDVYTNDIGLVVITSPDGKLEGFNVMVGGGLGRTHGKENTVARAADHLGFVKAEDVLHLCKCILATQRDHGNRELRANARMKYLVMKLGVDRFRELVESYFGKKN